MSGKCTFYSWIPNLTGNINFEFLSDNIVQEDGIYKLHQCIATNCKTVKYFLYEEWSFSDNIEDNKKGNPRHIICKIEKDSELLIGEFYEFVLNDQQNIENFTNLSQQIKDESFNEDSLKSIIASIPPKYQATFNIQFNGKIDITFPTIEDCQSLKNDNIALITYRAIKYILHKDIFHGEEEDTIIKVYDNEESDEEILKNMLKYVKGYERILKDSIKANPDNTKIKSDFYNILLIRAKGIITYIESFIYIFNYDNDKRNSFKKYLKLAKNTMTSMEQIIAETEVYNYKYQTYKEIKTFSILLLVSTSILITSWIKCPNILPIISILFAFLIVGNAAAYIYYDDVFKKTAFNKYLFEALKYSETFIKKRLTYYDKTKISHMKRSLIIAAIFFILFITVFFKYALPKYREANNADMNKSSYPHTTESNVSYQKIKKQNIIKNTQNVDDNKSNYSNNNETNKSYHEINKQNTIKNNPKTDT